MKASRRLTAAVIVAASLGVAGCSGGDGDGTAAPEPAAPAVELLDPLWSVEGVQAVSHPVAAGGSVVVVVAEDGGLFLVGYDPATGRERWRTPSAAPVSLGAFPDLGEVPPNPLVVDDTMIHLVPGDEPGLVHVEAIDGGTGEAVWRSEESEQLMAWLGFCDAGQSRACAVVAGEPEGSGQVQVRTPTFWAVNLADGTTDDEITGLAPRSSNPWNSLQSPQTAIASARGPGLAEESRVVAATGEELWTRSWQQLFGDLPFDLDEGFESRVYWNELDDLLLAMVDLSGDVSQPADGSGELVRWVTSAVEPDSGEVLWTVPGSGFCGWVNHLLLDVEGLGAVVDETDTLVRCDAIGTVERSDGRARSFDADITVTQVDLRSGETNWSVDLPDFDYWLNETPIVRLDPTTFAAELGDGTRFALDVATGEMRDAEADEVGWCMSTNEYRYEGALVADNVEGQTFPGARFTEPCDLDGTGQGAPAAVDEGVGSLVGDTFVWMDESGLHAAET